MSVSATKLLFLVLYSFLDRVARVREIAIELSERYAGVLFLVRPGERHAELQEIIGCLRPFRITLVALSKGYGRVGIFFALVIGFADPVLGVTSQRIVRVLLNETPQCFFGSRIVRLLYQAKREVILVQRRARRQYSGGRLAEAAAGACTRWLQGRLRRFRRAPGRGQRAGAGWGIGWRRDQRPRRQGGTRRRRGRQARRRRSTPRRERSGSCAGDRRGARRARRYGRRLPLPLKPHFDVAVDLLQASPQLLDPVRCVLDPPRQITHFCLEPVEAKFGIDRRAGTRSDGEAAATAIDLPLQHAEIFFQPLETILHR